MPRKMPTRPTFLSTPSARRATTGMELRAVAVHKFLSTPSARRATAFYRPGCQRLPISIHALREEGDMLRGELEPIGFLFLSTPSARRATSFLTACPRSNVLFLSTPSARRATASVDTNEPNTGNFYPRPPRGGRLRYSIQFTPFLKFLSTPSARRATAKTEKNISAFVSL